MTHSLIAAFLCALLMPPVLAIGIAETQITQPSKGVSLPPPLIAYIVNNNDAGPVNQQFAAGCGFAEAVNTPHGFVTVTATELSYMIHQSGASASTNATTWGTDNNNGNVNLGYGFPFSFFRRYSIYGKLGQLTTTRCWLGIGGGTVVNAAQTRLNADVVAAGTRGAWFRFSSGTDATWKGVVCDGVNPQTVIDLGVVPDLNPHRFRIDYDGIKITWSIDDVALGSLNFSVVSAVMVFNSIDNQNTANNVTFSWNNFFYLLQR